MWHLCRKWVPLLTGAGWQVAIESGAGDAAGFTDDQYGAKGAEIVAGRSAAIQAADVLLQVRTLGANPDAGRADLEILRAGQVVVGLGDPWGQPAAIKEMADRKLTLFAMELIPRITRAQSMDVLSSMATIAGYKAVLQAADHLPKMFPMLMTAAGTLTASKVLVIGAGVAGLQSIASARRLGAVVQAYDVRPVVKEQIESLGAKFVELNLDTAGAEDKGGYAKQLTDAQQQQQREQLADIIAECDVCITTAAIPGRPSPLLVIEDACAPDGTRFGDYRSGSRAGWQLRADRSRPNRDRPWSDDPGPDESPQRSAETRQPNGGEKSGDIPIAHDSRWPIGDRPER